MAEVYRRDRERQVINPENTRNPEKEGEKIIRANRFRCKKLKREVRVLRLLWVDASVRSCE
jgi:hypothetical protein